ncbi:CS1 type fimbrial major subunit [Pseudomonas sp. EA_5y_Pfl2_R50]|uniref:CS1 type fimbrial major subunit n=1 Tax=Pseudomonas sp. EA_5y_Pfl2_R50 TaxID=3088691 RepID=UPI0030DAF761
MLKQIALATTMTALAMNSVSVFAIDHVIQMTATVPENHYYVEPVDKTWLGKPVELIFRNDLSDPDFVKMVKQFDTKHTDPKGSIHTSLLNEAFLYDGTNKIDVEIKFGNKVLNTVPQETVGGTESVGGKRVDMVIAPQKPTGGYKAGAYTGTFTMVHEAVLAP